MSIRAWRILRALLSIAAVVTFAVAAMHLFGGNYVGRDPWMVAYLVIWPFWSVSRLVVHLGLRPTTPPPSTNGQVPRPSR